MSLFSSFTHFMSCRFGLTRPEPSDNILKKEAEYLTNKWDAEFTHNHKNYIDSDYKKFVAETYPAFIAKHKYAFVKGDTFPAPDRPKYSLALSGGGIRSAAFGIGVIQALNNVDLANPVPTNNNPPTDASAKENGLVKPTIFSKLVYLSTVSGGGYAGAALSWCMKKWEVYPFGEIKSFCGTKAERPEDKAIDFVGCHTGPITSLWKPDDKHNNSQDGNSTAAQPGKLSSNAILSYIRLHGKYLSPPELPLSSLIGSVINSVFHSFIAYTFLLSTFIFTLIYIANNIFPVDVAQSGSALSNLYAQATTFLRGIFNIDPNGSGSAKAIYRFAFAMFFFYLALAGLALFLITSFSYGISSYFTGIFSDNYQLRVRIQKLLGFLVKFIFVNIIFMAIPIQIEYLKLLPAELMGPGGVGAGLTALFMSINEFRKQLQSSTTTNSYFGNIVRDAIVVLFIYILLTMSYLLSELGYLHFRENWSIVIYLIPALALCFVVNINNISPHRMYRDRLMDTFLTDPTTDTYASLAKKGRLANEYRLAELDDGNHWAPYHLINTNIILNNSRNSQHNSRLGDSFLLSPKYCGSDATGYVPTKDFAFGTMTLATATSISGAAANPHSGVGGMGTSTTPLVSFLMTFFGLRLGYWANNPKHVLSRFKFFFKPNYFMPGGFSLLNFGHTENSSYIELSDGGHFDNTGVYELVRRRMPWIILSDGSADIKATFEDLGNALSRIRIDFGVTIRFNDPEFSLCGLIPGSQAESVFDKKFNLSARGYAIGDIVYPETPDSPAFVGTFVYIKATMTRDLPGDVYAYQADHPEFPNEPTSDQFFNERQFEAYRELGYQLTKQLMQNKIAMERLP